MVYNFQQGMMAGAASAGGADLGDEIANSLRLNDNDNAYVTKTYGSGSDQTTMWGSIWFKRGNLSTAQGLMGAHQNGSNVFMVYLNAADNLLVQAYDAASFTTNMVTNAKLRDTTGWYHMYWQVNTTNGNSGIWLNGVEQSLSTAVKDSTSDTYIFGGAHQHLIGTIRNTAGTYFPFDGYIAMAQFGFGATQAATDFGRYSTSHTNTWVPVNASGVTYGANGVLLDFAVAPGTGNGAGTDTSGNANHFTDTNLAANDQVTDTPTNVYPTLDPLNPLGTVVISNGNLQAGTTVNNGKYANWVIPDGKWYWEVNTTTLNAHTMWGIAKAGTNLVSGTDSLSGQYTHANSGLLSDDGTTTASWSSAVAAGSVVGVAVYKSGSAIRMWFADDNSWLNSGDPANNTNPAITDTITEDILPILRKTNATAWDVTINFGQLGLTHTPPTGFSELSQANFPNVVTDLGGVDKPYKHFAVAADTESNIEATLSAELNPTTYFKWFKNRSNIESWSFQFSHDSSNEHALASSDTYQSKRTLSGADNYAGFVFDTSGSNGMKTGAQAHTNGVATTVTHNLGSSRQAVFLFSRAGGDVYLYHPDVVAGSLIKLNASALAVSTQITNVTTNSFDIGSSAATQTYDWFVAVDTPGLIDIGFYDANASANGPFIYSGGTPEMVFEKNVTGSGSINVVDRARDTYNPSTKMLITADNAEVTNGTVDLLSTGFKLRSTELQWNNTSGQDHVFISFLSSAIGGGIPFPNAR